MQACPGCGLVLEHLDGPTHPYIGASAACWALYGEVLAREFSDVRYGRIHGTTVDAYALQHPGVPETRSIRSVGLHAIRMSLVLERHEAQQAATRIMSRVARSGLKFEWLEPPVPNGLITVREVSAATDPESHEASVQRWAEDLWGAWTAHHMRIREWLKMDLGG